MNHKESEERTSSPLPLIVLPLAEESHSHLNIIIQKDENVVKFIAAVYFL